MKYNKDKLKRITLSMQEIWQHTKPKIQESRKKYSRKDKHKGKDNYE